MIRRAGWRIEDSWTRSEMAWWLDISQAQVTRHYSNLEMFHPYGRSGSPMDTGLLRSFTPNQQSLKAIPKSNLNLPSGEWTRIIEIGL